LSSPLKSIKKKESENNDPRASLSKSQSEKTLHSQLDKKISSHSNKDDRLKRPETSLSKTSNSHSNGPKKPASSPPRSHSQTIPKKDVKSQSQSSLPEKKKISKDDEYDPLSSKAKTSISLQSKTQKPAKKPDEYDPLSYSADKKK